MTLPLDIARNRADRKWSRAEMAGRVLWSVAQPLFRFSPRPFWAWRRVLLRLFGAEIAASVHIFPTVRIAIPWNLSIGPQSSMGDGVRCYNLGRVRIGQDVTVSQGVHLCAGTHDYRLISFPLVKATITIGDGAWLCADAFVGPGVNVGTYAILAARSVAVKDIEAWTIAAGNPARPVKRREAPQT